MFIISVTNHTLHRNSVTWPFTYLFSSMGMTDSAVTAEFICSGFFCFFILVRHCWVFMTELTAWLKLNVSVLTNEMLARAAAQTAAATAKLRPIWRDKNIALKSKLKLLNALVLSIFLYACESWTSTNLQKKIQAAVEMRCFRRTRLGISYVDHITNEEVRRTIRQH